MSNIYNDLLLENLFQKALWELEEKYPDKDDETITRWAERQANIMFEKLEIVQWNR